MFQIDHVLALSIFSSRVSFTTPEDKQIIVNKYLLNSNNMTMKALGGHGAKHMCLIVFSMTQYQSHGMNRMNRIITLF